MSVQLLALACNIGLVALKFTVGNLAGSRALIADGFNSAGDVLATAVAWLAFRYARIPPDADHPYGHANAEALAGLLIGGMLCATGAFITIEGIDSVLGPRHVITVPDPIAMIAAAITIATKAGLWTISTRVGRRTNSPTLLASANDHSADVVTGAAALAGIALAQLGEPAFDAFAGIAIGAYVFWLGFAPLRHNVDILMQREPPQMADRVREVVALADEVAGIRQVRVQPIGGHFRIDLVLLVQRELTVDHGHRIAHRVEDLVRSEIPHVAEVVVHVEPA